MKLQNLNAPLYGLVAVLLASPMGVLADAKLEIIGKQQEMTIKERDAAKKATPYNEQRPAANTSQHKHSTESPKGQMIKGQMKETEQGIEDAAAAKPAVEGRPAVTTKKQLKPPSEGGKLDLIEAQKKATKKSIKDAKAANSAVDVKPAATMVN